MKASDIYTFGLAAELVKAAQWNEEFQEWEINHSQIIKSYKVRHTNPNGINLSPEQEARRWKIHVERERELWARTKDCWYLWSDDKLLFQAVEAGVVQYLQQYPVEEEHQPVETKPRGKGRKTCFRDKMLDDGDGRKLQILHKLIDGKGGNNARKIIDAAVSIGWLTKPSGSNVANEFEGISKSTFNNAAGTYKFDDCDIENTAKTLEKLLSPLPEA